MSENDKKYKIALVGYRLGVGGAERVMARLSIFFEQNGIEVHNIIILDVVEYEYSGKLLNLGKLKNNSENAFLNKFKRLVVINKYLKHHRFDFIIDFRFRIKPIQELIIARYIYNTKSIFTVHSYLIDNYMPNITWLTRLMYNKCYANIAITNQMKDLIDRKHGLKKLSTIYNPIDFDEVLNHSSENTDLDFEFIIAIGQYESGVKQFDKLILSYANSILPENKKHLVILGNGDTFSLNKIAVENKIDEMVHLLGFKQNPYKYIRQAKFLVLCSQNEGMPNVILESLACKTPVVSFDCLSGPREMIVDGKNGLLVENQNFEALSDAMNLLVKDKELYDFCKLNAYKSVEQFSINVIGNQWLELLKIK